MIESPLIQELLAEQMHAAILDVRFGPLVAAPTSCHAAGITSRTRTVPAGRCASR